MPKLMHIEFFDERLWVKILPRNNNLGWKAEKITFKGGTV
jgi:hypothetical protein